MNIFLATVVAIFAVNWNKSSATVMITNRTTVPVYCEGDFVIVEKDKTNIFPVSFFLEEGTSTVIKSRRVRKSVLRAYHTIKCKPIELDSRRKYRV